MRGALRQPMKTFRLPDLVESSMTSLEHEIATGLAGCWFVVTLEGAVVNRGYGRPVWQRDDPAKPPVKPIAAPPAPVVARDAPGPHEIMAAVVAVTALPKTLILSSGRTLAVIRARQALQVLLHRLLPVSTSWVGKWTRRHHSTVLSTLTLPAHLAAPMERIVAAALDHLRARHHGTDTAIEKAKAFREQRLAGPNCH